MFWFSVRWASSAQARRGQRAAGWNDGGSGGMRWDGSGKSPSHSLRAEENRHVCVPEIETPQHSAPRSSGQLFRGVINAMNDVISWVSRCVRCGMSSRGVITFCPDGRLGTIWWCHVLHVITIMDSCLYSWWTICTFIQISIISLSIYVDWYVVLWLIMWFYMSLRLFMDYKHISAIVRKYK